MADPAGWDPQLTAWLDLVERGWRSLGLTDSAVARLRRDLVVDLAQARLGGAPVEELIGPDPAEFAAEVAQADNEARARPPITAGNWSGVPRSTQGLVLTALAGAVLGAALSLVTLYPVGIGLVASRATTYEDEGRVILTLHVMAACMAALTAAAVVRWHFRSWGNRNLVAVVTCVALLVSGAAASGLAIGVGWLTNYRTDPNIVVTEVAIVVGVCACGLVAAARILGLQRPPESHPHQGPPASTI